MSTTQKVELIDKKEFAGAALNENAKTFVIHVIASLALAIQVYLFWYIQFELLLADKALIKVLSKYLDYSNVFLFDFAMKLFENASMNEHTIELVEGKQPFYGPIYSLGLVELETLKTYIETNLKTGFI